MRFLLDMPVSPRLVEVLAEVPVERLARSVCVVDHRRVRVMRLPIET